MKTVEETFHIAYEETLKIIPKTLYSFKQANNEGVLKEYHIKQNIKLPQEYIDLFAKYLVAGIPLEPI